MSTAYVSRDGHWTVTMIKRDGVDLIRVEHDTFAMGEGVVPLHQQEDNRTGSLRTAHGYLVADLRSVDELARYIPLGELKRDRGGEQ